MLETKTVHQSSIETWQPLFPKKTLIQEEAEWCDKFRGATMFDPIYTEDVTDEKSFMEMIERNHHWLDDHVTDAKSSSDRAKYKLPYFEKVAYGD